MANRKRQSTPAFKAEQARRCGIEGTLSYGVRTCGMRRARYSEDFTRVLPRRLTTILPAMSLAEAIETTCLHRVAGLTGARTAVVPTRPINLPPHHLGCGADRRRADAVASSSPAPCGSPLGTTRGLLLRAGHLGPPACPRLARCRCPPTHSIAELVLLALPPTVVRMRSADGGLSGPTRPIPSAR
jgi:hypothetical protein